MTLAEEVTAADFSDLIALVRREQRRYDFPSFFEQPDALYSAEQVSFRQQCYGPLFDDPETLAFLCDFGPQSIGQYSQSIDGSDPAR